MRESCDIYCPYIGAGGACGLPEPYEILKMLEDEKVWMCHSNESVPCVVTELDRIPKGFTPIYSEEYVLEQGQ